MLLLRLYFVIILLTIKKVNASFGDESYSPSHAYIIPERVYLCEDTDSIIDLYVDLRNINNKGDKVVDIEFNLEDMQLTDQWKLNLVLDKWNNGDWDKDFYIADGLVCEQFLKYVSGAWENLKKLIKPTISEKCFIDSGHYKVTDFTVKPTDLNLPVAVLGKYRVTSKLFDETNEEMFCHVIELEIRKKLFF